jgi:hypothetical protein
VVVATGIASVAVQLVCVREYLAQFQGNEIVIALIFFCWLVFGGIGTAAAKGDPKLGTASIANTSGHSLLHAGHLFSGSGDCHSLAAGPGFHSWRVGGVSCHLGIRCRHPPSLCAAGGFRAAIQPVGCQIPVGPISRQLDLYGGQRRAMWPARRFFLLRWFIG